MSENKCCGNCNHFKNEDVNGFGLCGKDGVITRCNTSCSDYSSKLNGWTEITPDNVDMIDDGSIVIVTDGTYYNKASDWGLSLNTMAKCGGYYYYELPELKLE